MRLFDPPIKLPTFSIETVWHERNHNDPAHAWLRGVIAGVARTL